MNCYTENVMSDTNVMLVEKGAAMRKGFWVGPLRCETLVEAKELAEYLHQTGGLHGDALETEVTDETGAVLYRIEPKVEFSW